MKSLFTCLALLAFISANAQKILKTDSVYITGKIGKLENNGEQANSLKIVVNDLAFGKQQTYLTDINHDGTYKLSFLKTSAQDVTLGYNNQLETILVEPGNHMLINFDADDVTKSITFAGDGAVLNREFKAYLDAGVNQISSRSDTINKLIKDNEPEAYKKILADIYAKESAALTTYFKEHKVSRTLKTWATNDLKYEYFSNLMHYPIWHPYFNKLKAGSFKVADSYYDFINLADLNNIEGTISSNYGKYVAENNDQLIDKKFGNSYSFDSLFNYFIKEPATLSKDVLLSNQIYILIKSGNLDDVKLFLDRYQLAVQQPQFKASILNAYNDQAFLQNHAKIPKAAQINNVPEIAADSIFNKILAKYAGKVVYVDFWATWCGPCRGEMPDSKKLHKSLAGKDVIFLYLGVESVEKAWKVAIAEMGIEGEHFLLSNTDYNAVSTKFKISSIPRYFLIDKQNNIVDANAKRPSDVTLKSEIEKLLAAK